MVATVSHERDAVGMVQVASRNTCSKPLTKWHEHINPKPIYHYYWTTAKQVDGSMKQDGESTEWTRPSIDGENVKQKTRAFVKLGYQYFCYFRFHQKTHSLAGNGLLLNINLFSPPSIMAIPIDLQPTPPSLTPSLSKDSPSAKSFSYRVLP